MSMTKKEMAIKIAEACPLDDESVYQTVDVERIMSAIPDVIAAALMEDDTVTFPGLCKITKKVRAPFRSHLRGGTDIPAGWKISVSPMGGFAKKVKEKLPPPL